MVVEGVGHVEGDVQGKCDLEDGKRRTAFIRPFPRLVTNPSPTLERRWREERGNVTHVELE